jgi:glycosyltransferase involved in cell wall biosynthesis
VVILQRLLRPDISLDMVDRTFERAKKDGVCLIYETDDDFLNARPAIDSAVRDPLLQKCIFMRLASECAGVIASTEPLKDRLLSFNKRVVVVPNAIDERLFGESSSFCFPHRNTIGYMGTPTHQDDLALVLQALRAVSREIPFELEIAGGLAERRARSLFWRFSPRLLDTAEYSEYPLFVDWMREHMHWDLAIAPLEETEFNDCKSDMKFLDYSALGIPAIYSNVPAYSNTVKHMETGYLAPNTTDGWTEALSFMLSNSEQRHDIGQAAQKYVRTHRTLEHCAHRWLDAINTILG